MPGCLYHYLVPKFIIWLLWSLPAYYLLRSLPAYYLLWSLPAYDLLWSLPPYDLLWSLPAMTCYDHCLLMTCYDHYLLWSLPPYDLLWSLPAYYLLWSLPVCWLLSSLPGRISTWLLWLPGYSDQYLVDVTTTCLLSPRPGYSNHYQAGSVAGSCDHYLFTKPKTWLFQSLTGRISSW